MSVSAPSAPVCVLLNPHAAGGRAAALAAPMQAWLRTHAPHAEWHTGHDAAAARRKLQSLPHQSRVVVVGGDGTLNQLLPALLEGEHTLALVPFGSGNDSARALGLYKAAWPAALAHALGASASSVDIGELQFSNADGEHRIPFFSSCTAGFDSSVGLRALQGPRWLRGLPRYLLATVRELIHLRNWQVQVQADAQPVHAGAVLFASVLNTPSFGSGMPAVPHARVDDGRLDLLVAGRFDRLSTLAMLPRLLAGSHLGHARVHTRPFASLQLSSADPIALATDGEYRGEALEVRVVVRPAALHVVRGPVTG